MKITGPWSVNLSKNRLNLSDAKTRQKERTCGRKTQIVQELRYFQFPGNIHNESDK